MKYATASFLIFSIAFYSPMAALLAVPAMQKQAAGDDGDLLDKSYLELFELASQTEVSKVWIENRKKALEEEKKREKQRLKNEKNRIEDQIDQAQEQLGDLNEDAEETRQAADRRHALHCRIQSLRKDLHDTELILESGLDVRYDNLQAKLRILEEWPQEYAELQRSIENNQVTDRKFADFRDIGFREGDDGVFEGQKDDVKRGREAIQELKRQDLLPPEITDEEVAGYIRSLSQRIARHSDLSIPIKVALLKSEEINAFALPGGFLFINSGLAMQAENESELAGVIAHEIAHVTARHGHRLMNKAQIAGIIFQAAQIAALVLTGGVSSIGTYYALQYGFLGLGMIMNLTLLGVSRDFEQEADILGTQYLWDAGYDTGGFVSFFGRMAEEKGYITGLSWFRTHPPFYKRMSLTFREMTIMPEKENPIVDRPEFQQTKERLKGLLEQMKDQDEDAPTLKRVYDCEDSHAESQRR